MASPFPLEAALHNPALKQKFLPAPLRGAETGATLRRENRGESGKRLTFKLLWIWLHPIAPSRVETTLCLTLVTQKGLALHKAFPKSGTNAQALLTV